MGSAWEIQPGGEGMALGRLGPLPGAIPEHISSAMVNPNQLSVGLEKAEGVSLLLLSQFGKASTILRRVPSLFYHPFSPV